jgi:hypothetical protein
MVEDSTEGTIFSIRNAGVVITTPPNTLAVRIGKRNEPPYGICSGGPTEGLFSALPVSFPIRISTMTLCGQLSFLKIKVAADTEKQDVA